MRKATSMIDSISGSIQVGRDFQQKRFGRLLLRACLRQFVIPLLQATEQFLDERSARCSSRRFGVLGELTFTAM